MGNTNNTGPMLNFYPDSMGRTLADVVKLLKDDRFKDVFTSAYVLPSLYHSDLDRGFSVVDYDLNEQIAKEVDLAQLYAMGIDLKLDFILNHASVSCKEFQDILKNGEASPYRDFFIDWNRFWEGHGQMTEQGYIQPNSDLIKDMFFRKPGLPILMVQFPDGSYVPYWNTFYQEVRYSEVDGSRQYLGQMDLNIKSPLVWDYYNNTLKNLAGYGAKIIRLDAFAYAPKTVGKRNFLNQPDTFELLNKIKLLADQYQLTLLPEIHAGYEEKTYEMLAQAGYMCYDFFLPGLVIDAIENGSGQRLCAWAEELAAKKIRTVNMLGCHDGIPLLDLKGLLSEEQIQALIDTVVSRGGLVKDLHGQKNVYYQVNATYFSALGEDEQKMLLARAIQLFMPGKPQVWYLDLFAGCNDLEAVRNAGEGSHKEINRTNLSLNEIESSLEKQVVKKQLELLRFRNTFNAFGFDAAFEAADTPLHQLHWTWRKDGFIAHLEADLKSHSFSVWGTDENGKALNLAY